MYKIFKSLQQFWMSVQKKSGNLLNAPRIFWQDSSDKAKEICHQRQN